MRVIRCLLILMLLWLSAATSSPTGADMLAQDAAMTMHASAAADDCCEKGLHPAAACQLLATPAPAAAFPPCVAAALPAGYGPADLRLAGRSLAPVPPPPRRT